MTSVDELDEKRNVEKNERRFFFQIDQHHKNQLNELSHSLPKNKSCSELSHGLETAEDATNKGKMYAHIVTIDQHLCC